MMKNLFLFIVLTLQLSAAYTQNVKLPSISFPIENDKDIKVMQRNCQWCHSYGYILNQGKQSKEFWHHIVLKMRDVYHAPINPRDEKIATEYLFRHYGNGKLK
ncbi:MAG TPA: sulfite:cytochrome C oxidoreductase subunit B [Sulfurimonas autotrophica]|uniref:Sulfite:cytochrome C oxidoreductase subunit B n=1 Tax=Sulfurimonas autotrophica TaxID=202747 RepID=A0A7C3C7A2_9BACT|nr:sulfite:cytochrome C oxidoreductase subunit B [Sulfurimonas autotrophica]